MSGECEDYGDGEGEGGFYGLRCFGACGLDFWGQYMLLGFLVLEGAFWFLGGFDV